MTPKPVMLKASRRKIERCGDRASACSAGLLSIFCWVTFRPMACRLFDLTMFATHNESGAAVGHPGLVLPERKQEILFPPDMPFTAPFESLFRFRHVLSFQRLKRLKQGIEPIVIVLKKPADGPSSTRDEGSSSNVASATTTKAGLKIIPRSRMAPVSTRVKAATGAPRRSAP